MNTLYHPCITLQNISRSDTMTKCLTKSIAGIGLSKGEKEELNEILRIALETKWSFCSRSPNETHETMSLTTSSCNFPVEEICTSTVSTKVLNNEEIRMSTRSAKDLKLQEDCMSTDSTKVLNQEYIFIYKRSTKDMKYEDSRMLAGSTNVLKHNSDRKCKYIYVQICTVMRTSSNLMGDNKTYSGIPISLHAYNTSNKIFNRNLKEQQWNPKQPFVVANVLALSQSNLSLHRKNRQSRRPITQIGPAVHLTTQASFTGTTETRKNTFLFTWPQHIGKWWPHMLADAGFFYLGKALDLQCFKCKLKTSVNDWIDKENPSQAHARLNPNCRYVLKMGFTPMKREEQNVLNTSKENTEAEKLEHEHAQAKKEDADVFSKQLNYAFIQQHPTARGIQTDNKMPDPINGYINVSNRTENNPRLITQLEMFLQRVTSNVQNRKILHENMTRVSNENISQLACQLQTVTDSMNSQLTMDIGNPSIREPDFKYPQYKLIVARERSFNKWMFSQKQTPKALSEAGYFYTGESDIVRCFCCDLGLAEWDPKDDPWIEHARHNPRCWFLKNQKGDEYIRKIQEDWRKIYNPKHAAFDDKKSRLSTFDDWRTDIEQTPEVLADAGFFYTGEGDIVRCHYCDGGLRHWEPGDVPWEEHARWFPYCKFVIKMKGRQYIDEVKTEAREKDAELSEKTNTTSNANYNVNHPALKKIQDYEIPTEKIKIAAHEFIRRNGHSNFNEEELMKIIFDDDHHYQQTQRNSYPVQSKILADPPQERDPEKLLEMNRKLKDKLKCVRCRTNEISILFVNCGHRLTCEKCAYKMDFCPCCDTKIKKRLKTYLS